MQHPQAAVLRHGGVRHITARVTGVTLGAVFVPVDLLGALAGLCAPQATRSVIRLERWRISTLLDGRLRHEPRGWRSVAYLAARSFLGILTGAALALIAADLVAVPTLTLCVLAGGEVTAQTVAVIATALLVMLSLAIQGIIGGKRLESKLWNAIARPGNDELEEWVTQLTVTLADVVDAIDDERRRIERDIHDGVQQRVVALSILLGRAERHTDPEERAALHRRAVDETQHILDDLRNVSWRIYPAMLARDGLGPALEALRERTHLPIRLDDRLTTRPPKPVESAAYFVASEAVTNVVKHAAAQSIDITVEHDAGQLIMTVRDDGVGGADPAGAGISGITSRVTALAGRFDVASPPGGPTTITVAIPCA